MELQTQQLIEKWLLIKFCELLSRLSPGYTLASPASSAVASQLKQAVSLGQDLTTYTTYEGYPAFAVATRHTDGYGVF